MIRSIACRSSCWRRVVGPGGDLSPSRWYGATTTYPYEAKFSHILVLISGVLHLSHKQDVLSAFRDSSITRTAHVSKESLDTFRYQWEEVLREPRSTLCWQYDLTEDSECFQSFQQISQRCFLRKERKKVYQYKKKIIVEIYEGWITLSIRMLVKEEDGSSLSLRAHIARIPNTHVKRTANKK